jgi:menaquinone-dependent protoporphyrinogen oxidase
MAETVIVYQSSHGNTEKILKELTAGKTSAQVLLIKVDQAEISDLEQAGRIVLGGSIHAGKIQKEVGSFIDRHRELLLKKPLALFIGCLDKKHSVEELENAFPEDLKNHAELKTAIGGNVNPEKLSWFLRIIMKFIIKKEEDRSFECAEGREKLLAFINR